MVSKQRPQAPESWAYAYQLNPPQPEPRFARVKMLLRRARLAAQREGRVWTGQIVMDAHITHILVVTDAPDEVRAVDRAIDAELKRLKMDFAITGPARVSLPGVTPRRSAPKTPPRAVGHLSIT
ncbi:MAG TPA: hypothetical protein VI653_13105 [Steroidobacteraceae bacterium]